MKKILIIGLAVVLIVTLIPGLALADKPDTKGNGLPKDAGKSFNFNVIAVPNPKQNWDMDSGGNGKRIFILRTGKTQFYVQGGDTFAIMDHDGTDGKVGTGGSPGGGPGEETGLTSAGIILPYDTGTDAWDCTVYVRLLGPPDSHFQWTSYYWYDDYAGGAYWALISTFQLDRNTKFAVPTGQILKDAYQDILWEWDAKHNLRVCQFRIFVGAPASGYP
jgi:hypothetical protein